MESNRKCVLCGCGVDDDDMECVPDKSARRWSCRICGSVEMPDSVLCATEYWEKVQKKHVLSALAREREEFNRGRLVIEARNDIDALLNSPEIPRTVLDKLDKLILYLGEKSDTFGKQLEFDLERDYPLAYCVNGTELREVLNALKNMRRIEERGGSISLTVDGWRRFEELKKTRFDSNQCFVAMWFDDDMKKVYNEYIKTAIENDVGRDYKAVIVARDDYNEDVVDQIVAGIRRCRFLIADLTGHRHGVYFEAGFAMGLNKPVIFTCRKDHKDKVHFDIEHFNRIEWETGEELRTRLTNRILATIPE